MMDKATTPKRVLVTGATGAIGHTRLSTFARAWSYGPLRLRGRA